MLTGQPVFRGDTPVATALAHVQTGANHRRGVRSAFTIPPALDALIMDCLAKNPEARPASAAVRERAARGNGAAADAWTLDAARASWERQQAFSRIRTTTAGAAEEEIRSGRSSTPAAEAEEQATHITKRRLMCKPAFERG